MAHQSGGGEDQSPGGDVATEAGRDMVAQVRAASGKILGAAYGAVSAEELAIAARVLVTITARMSEELARA
ncbi:hypothetical protein ABIA39_001221 [Nocardia sp. GAS34]|uniref:hypothetical protein n=1 Tax=unclassified Nocardia TaxID=2637762 RepID=UPI003D249348